MVSRSSAADCMDSSWLQLQDGVAAIGKCANRSTAVSPPDKLSCCSTESAQHVCSCKALTVVANTLPRLPRRCIALVGRHRSDCAVCAEDSATDPAVVPAHQHAEWCFTLIAGLALAVIHPVVLGSCCLVPSDCLHKLGEELLHFCTLAPLHAVVQHVAAAASANAEHQELVD
jgi:hypothetical protein